MEGSGLVVVRMTAMPFRTCHCILQVRLRQGVHEPHRLADPLPAAKSLR